MKPRLCVLVVAVLVACTFAADPVTRPKTILVIRHAEKPDDDKDIDLSPTGKKRAEALPDLFRKSASRPAPFPTPDFIFAAAKSKHSDRSVKTVTPLETKLGLKVNKGFKDEDFADLAKELLTNPKYGGKTVLVCWHHGNIPELIESLGVTPKPHKIKDRVFDQAWLVTFDAKGKAKPVETLPQALLPGDSK